jgi:NTE family protein
MASSGIGLSLSGGGYRASAFHLGTLQKLDELGILPEISVLSTISGGSITGAAYAVTTINYADFHNDMIRKISTKDLIRSALFSVTGLQTLIFFAVFIGAAAWLLYTPYPWVSFLVLALMFYVFLRYQFHIFPVSREIEKLYAKHFTENLTVGDVKAPFRFVIGSTNLQTARPFVFSKEYMGDSAYDFLERPVHFKPESFPLAKAVMASSCVPFAFSPVSIPKEYFLDPSLYSTVDPVIVDGGVYDNQGIHKLVQSGRFSSDVVITSDAGNKLSFNGSYPNMISIAVRSMNVFMARIKNAQMVSDIYDNHYKDKREIAYLSLGWNAEDCIPGFIKNLKAGNIPSSVIASHALKDEWVRSPDDYKAEITDHLKTKIKYADIKIPTEDEVKIARNVGTNLTALKIPQINALIKQASCLTEIQVKLYCPSLIK